MGGSTIFQSYAVWYNVVAGIAEHIGRIGRPEDAGRIRVKLMRTEECTPGMYLGEDIVNHNGVVFLGSGTRLTAGHLKNLLQLGIDTLYIATPERTEELENDVILFDRQLNQEFKKTITSFKNVYQNVRLGNQIILDELKDSITPLIGRVVTNNNILGNLRMIEVVDEYTYKHSINVGMVASMIGKWLGYGPVELMDIALAGMLHDIGKSRIPLEIINKPARLTEAEFDIIKTHSRAGYEILSESTEVNFDVRFGVLEHHEWINGGGYPNGSSGKKIHEYARIVAVADVFDAITSNRSYKSKISPFRAAEIVMEESVTHLDPEIVQLFLSRISQFYVGNTVQLNTGEIGEIVMVNRYNLTRPLVRVKERFYDLSSNYRLQIVEVLK